MIADTCELLFGSLNYLSWTAAERECGKGDDSQDQVNDARGVAQAGDWRRRVTRGKR